MRDAKNELEPLHVQLPADVVGRIRYEADRLGMKIRTYVEMLLREGLRMPKVKP